MKKALLLSIFMLNLAFAIQEVQNFLADYMAQHCSEFLHLRNDSYQMFSACITKLSNQCINDDNSDSCFMGAIALVLGGKLDTAQVLAQRACQLDKKKCEFANSLRRRR